MKNLLLTQDHSFAYKVKNTLINCFIMLLVFVAVNSYGSNTFSSYRKKTSTAPPMIRLNMSGAPNYLDECVIYYQAGATDDFDSDYDAYKLFGPNPAPHISVDYNTTLMAINGISPVAQSFTTSIRATTHATGNFTITASDVQDLPTGTCVLLTDLFTNTTVNLLITPYSFNLLSTTTTSRFILKITYNTLPISSELTQPSCQTVNGGKIKIIGNGNNPFNYIWTNTSGAIMKNSIGIAGSDSLTNLSSGNYHVEVTSVSDACYRNEADFNIIGVTIPVSSFSSPDTVIASTSINFSPSNLSTDCENYSWNFGDATAINNNFEPSHVYSTPGVYNVKMIGISNTGCKDSTTKAVTVMALSTNISDITKQDIKLINVGNNSFVIKLNSSQIDELGIELYDLTGKNISKERKENLKGTENVFLNFDGFVNGIYLISINHQDKNLSTSKIMIN